jgi:hypothetical protein
MVVVKIISQAPGPYTWKGLDKETPIVYNLLQTDDGWRFQGVYGAGSIQTQRMPT